ncbi:uncharacterized protein LOC143198693 [Rhynchophorus ferrugineus]|uniref:uncharacterized protein LOC143198693 n=1 Tax=Rhynchophorus ferrugineus TaxID=354439 RepID=UPI003FCCC790
MPSDNHKIVIRADKTPAGQHTRRFNAPTIDEVAIVVVGENLESRDIVLHRRNFQLQPIKETHRSYDALQYPIIFWQGEDGYDLSIKMINPITGSETNKKVSSMNYYSYRLMIRENADNHILKCRRLYHKYVDDMYVKIETERLTFIRLNQTKLRSEEYIHLRDAINTDGNAQNVGRMTILPATYIGSPRHMHEYAQDAMSYVRHYGTADLFITFTCNPQWIEIKQELLPGKSSIDRHDITARVFRQKLKSLMNFIVKHNVFGETRCWMYSVEWQKRGLPHAHILIWSAEDRRMLCQTYSNYTPLISTCEKWFRRFKTGDCDTEDKNTFWDPYKIQEKYAKLLGVSQETLSNLLKNTGVSIERRLAMCEMLLQWQNRKSFYVVSLLVTKTDIIIQGIIINRNDKIIGTIWSHTGHAPCDAINVKAEYTCLMWDGLTRHIQDAFLGLAFLKASFSKALHFQRGKYLRDATRHVPVSYPPAAPSFRRILNPDAIRAGFCEE